jgi:CheY-like chemotaxis protein
VPGWTAASIRRLSVSLPSMSWQRSSTLIRRTVPPFSPACRATASRGCQSAIGTKQWLSATAAAGDAMRGAGYDLVLVDLMLPYGRVIGFLKGLRARGDVTPVIVLAALDQVADRIERLNAGADDYLVKPFDLA